MGNKVDVSVGPNPTFMWGEMSHPLPSPHVPAPDCIWTGILVYMTWIFSRFLCGSSPPSGMIQQFYTGLEVGWCQWSLDSSAGKNIP